MEAALPYVDDFLPAHNLASLADLASRLAELRAVGRLRRQRIVHRSGSMRTSVTW